MSAKTQERVLRRDKREKELAGKITALPDVKVGAILGDPGWKLDMFAQSGMEKSADNHYLCQDIEEIKKIDVPSIAADDCVLFLWATVPMLPQALEVMAYWGFEYKSSMVWVKDRPATGFWFINRHEILLVGVTSALNGDEHVHPTSVANAEPKATWWPQRRAHSGNP